MATVTSNLRVGGTFARTAWEFRRSLPLVSTPGAPDPPTAHAGVSIVARLRERDREATCHPIHPLEYYGQ